MAHYTPTSRRGSSPPSTNNPSSASPSPPLTTSRVSAQPPQLGLPVELDRSGPTSKAFRLLSLSPSPSPDSPSTALPPHPPAPLASRRTSSAGQPALAAHDALLDWSPESSTAGSSPDRRTPAPAARAANREGKLTALLGLPAEPVPPPDPSNLYPSSPSSPSLSSASTPTAPAPALPNLPSTGLGSGSGSLSARKHGRRTSLSIGFGLGFGGGGSKEKDGVQSPTTTTTTAASSSSPVTTSFKRSISSRQALGLGPSSSSAGLSGGAPSTTTSHSSASGSGSGGKTSSPLLGAGSTGMFRRPSADGPNASSSTSTAAAQQGLTTSRSTSSVGSHHGWAESLSASAAAAAGGQRGRRGSAPREQIASAISAGRRGSSGALAGGQSLSAASSRAKEKEKEKELKSAGGGGGGGSMKDLVGFLRWGGRKDKEDQQQAPAVVGRVDEEVLGDEGGGRGVLGASLAPLPRFQARAPTAAASTGGSGALARSQSITSSSSRSLLGPSSSTAGSSSIGGRRVGHLGGGGGVNRPTPSPSLSSLPPSPLPPSNPSSPAYIHIDSLDAAPSLLYPRPPGGLSQHDLLLAHAFWVQRTLSPRPSADALAAGSADHRLFYVPPGSGSSVREERDKWDAERRGQGWGVERKLDWWFETGERVGGWDFASVVEARMGEPARRRGSAKGTIDEVDEREADGSGPLSPAARTMAAAAAAATAELDGLSPRSSTASFATSQSSFATSLLTTPTGQTLALDTTPRKGSAGDGAGAHGRPAEDWEAEPGEASPASKVRLTGVGQAARDRRRDGGVAPAAASTAAAGGPRRPSRTAPVVGPISGPAPGLSFVDGRF